MGAAVEEGTSVADEGDADEGGAVEVTGTGVRVAAKVACRAAAVAWIGGNPLAAELSVVAVGEEPPQPRIASDTNMTSAPNNFIGEPLGDLLSNRCRYVNLNRQFGCGKL